MFAQARITVSLALSLILSLIYSPAASFAQSCIHEQRYNAAARAAVRPHRLWHGTTGTLPVPPGVLKRIRITLHREDPPDPEDRVDINTFPATIVTLGATSYQAIEVNASGIVCGATGNCPIWLFERNTGAALITDNGYDFLYTRTLNHGYPDISVQHNLSCCDGTRNDYSFNGTQYKLLRSVVEETQSRPRFLELYRRP